MQPQQPLSQSVPGKAGSLMPKNIAIDANLCRMVSGIGAQNGKRPGPQGADRASVGAANQM